MIKNIFSNWDLIWAFVARDLRGRYIGSVMGLFWTVIHPLTQILIFSIIFNMINRGALVGLSGGGLDYTIFLCSGLLPWIAFQEFMMRVTGVFINNSNLIKKVSFPREILIVQELISSMITLMISYTIFFTIILFFGGWGEQASWTIFLLPFILLLQVTFSLALGLIMSTLNVFLRDIGQILSVVLMAWFWLSPIVYPVNVLFSDHNNMTYETLNVPRIVHTVMTNGPWYYLSKWYREVIYLRTVPQFIEIAGFTVMTALLLWAGVSIYKSMNKDIPDMI